jgi:hypothetical protein
VSGDLPRRRVARHRAPRYPDLHAFLLITRRAMVGAGLVTVAIGLSSCQEYGGMQPPDSDTPHQETGIMGDMEAPAEDHPIQLPATGSRELAWPGDQGIVSYHVLIRLDSWTVLYWFEDHAEEALAAIDEILLQQSIASLAQGGDHQALENNLLHALDRLFATMVGDETDDILEVQLSIDSLPAR